MYVFIYMCGSRSQIIIHINVCWGSPITRWTTQTQNWSRRLKELFSTLKNKQNDRNARNLSKGEPFFGDTSDGLAGRLCFVLRFGSKFDSHIASYTHICIYMRVPSSKSHTIEKTHTKTGHKQIQQQLQCMHRIHRQTHSARVRIFLMYT